MEALVAAIEVRVWKVCEVSGVSEELPEVIVRITTEMIVANTGLSKTVAEEVLVTLRTACSSNVLRRSRRGFRGCDRNQPPHRSLVEA